jgi:hypothetical protein
MLVLSYFKRQEFENYDCVKAAIFGGLRWCNLHTTMPILPLTGNVHDVFWSAFSAFTRSTLSFGSLFQFPYQRRKKRPAYGLPDATDTL